MMQKASKRGCNKIKLLFLSFGQSKFRERVFALLFKVRNAKINNEVCTKQVIIIATG